MLSELTSPLCPVVKRFSQLLNIGRTGSSSTPAAEPSTVPVSVAAPSPLVPILQVAARSSPVEEPKKQRKKTTAKRARTKVTSPHAQEGQSAAQPGYYGVNTAEQQASSKSLPAMWR